MPEKSVPGVFKHGEHGYECGSGWDHSRGHITLSLRPESKKHRKPILLCNSLGVNFNDRKSVYERESDTVLMEGVHISHPQSQCRKTPWKLIRQKAIPSKRTTATSYNKDQCLQFTLMPFSIEKETALASNYEIFSWRLNDSSLLNVNHWNDVMSERRCYCNRCPELHRWLPVLSNQLRWFLVFIFTNLNGR